MLGVLYERRDMTNQREEIMSIKFRLAIKFWLLGFGSGRTLIFGLLLGSLFASLLFAMPQSNKQRETIWLGSDLTLGMSEETVVTTLTESYNLRKAEPPAGLRAMGVTTMWIVQEKGKNNALLGTMFFASGKLHSVSKPLLSDDGDAVEFGRQLYFAMRDLELEGDTHCIVQTESGEVPDFSQKTANLRCGMKTIVIGVQKIKGYDETVQLNEELNAR